jgi:hypothetical protein
VAAAGFEPATKGLSVPVEIANIWHLLLSSFCSLRSGLVHIGQAQVSGLRDGVGGFWLG